METTFKRSSSKGRIVLLVVVLLILAAGIAGLIAWLVIRSRHNASIQIKPEDLIKIDCYPEEMGNPVTEEKCAQRGCVYDPHVHEKIPKCYIPSDGEYGYRVYDTSKTKHGFRYHMYRKSKPGIYGNDIKELIMDIEMRKDNLLRIKVDTF